MDSLSDQIFGNRYQLLNELGSGSMGTVYRAFDRLNRQDVALKRVMVQRGGPDESVYTAMNATLNRVALAHEFQTLASLRHPHIINVLDYGFDSVGQPFFTMSLIDKPQPITRAAKGQSLELKIRFLVQMLQALAYLHRRGIIHRDLKPDNALVTGSEEVKLLDFGLALLREREQEGNDLSRTLAYIAPEVLQGEVAHKTADLYAVGVIAYELLAGHHPFNETSISDLIDAILSRLVDVDVLGVDIEIAAIVQRLLDKLPENRYPDAYEVITALRNAIHQSIPHQTAAIRESSLQAATLVGHDH